MFINLLCLNKSIAQVTVSGSVSDQTGLDLPGVNIVEKGTLNGVFTDVNGDFTIIVENENAILSVSFIGYKTLDIPLEGRTNINIVMEDALTNLDEVVVVGYGSQKRASLVGAISTARVTEMENIAASNLSNSIGGRISGVITRSGEGEPGNDNATILIRGRGTTNDSSPLVLVDGIESSLNRINPADIESFSVLKDASATAVYGVRGANGVIIITTKRGQTGSPVINVNSQLRLHSIISFPNFLNSYDYARLYNEAIWNGGSVNQFYSDEDLRLYKSGESPYTHPDIDWYELMVEPTYPEHRHDINMSGGGELVKYYVSAEYVSQSGAYKQWENMDYKTNNAYERMNLRANFDFDIGRSSQILVNMSGRMEDVHGPNGGDYFGSNRNGMWDNIIVTRPNAMAPLNPDGSFGNSSDTRNVEHGYIDLRQGGFRNSKYNQLEGNIRWNQKLNFIADGLAARFMYGLMINDGYNLTMTEKPPSYQFDPADSSYTQITRPVLPYYNFNNNSFNQTNYVETAITYDKTIKQDHEITALLLYNINSRIFAHNPPASQLGFAGRITYGYKNKYLAEFNAGYNGSDQFVSGNRFAFLPAFSLGYTISEEEFFNSKIINFLKVRGSIGKVANDKIGNYRYLYQSTFNRLFPWDDQENFRTGYAFGLTPDIRYNTREGTLGNDNVTWETAEKQNIGIDIWMFNSKLNIAIDAFREHRSDILDQRRTITQIFGVSRSQLPPQNFGEVENKGFETEIKTMPSIGEINFSVSANFSFARNKRLFFDEVIQELDYMNATGRPIGQIFGYTWSGEFYSYEELGYIWDETVEGANKYVLPENAQPLVPVPDDGAQPGDLKFTDRNSDGIIDAYDVGYIGKSNTPEYIYGLNLGAEYKGISVNTFWQGAGGFSNYFLNTSYLREFVNGAKVHEIHLGRWAYFPELGIDTRETATYPRLGIDGSAQTRKISTFGLIPGNYLRLKTIEISYNLPDKFIQSFRMRRARIYIVGSNLLTFSELDFIDPESPMGSASFYPQSKYYGAGISVSF